MKVDKAEQIAADLRRRIATGEIEGGTQIPTIRRLMLTYSARSKGPVERALRTLEAEGLLFVRQGSGAFVRVRHVVHRDLADGLVVEFQRALAGDTSEGLFEAMTGTDDVVVKSTYAYVRANERVAASLQVDPGTVLLERTFRHVVKGDRHQTARSYMTADLADRAGLVDAKQERPGVGTVLQLLRAGVTVETARFTIEARMPTPEEADDLEMPPGTPVVEAWRVLKVADHPVEASQGIIRSDLIGYYLDVDLKGITL